VRLAEAPSFGRPVLFHDKDSRGALSYLALAGEMLRREEEKTGEPEPGVDLAEQSASHSLRETG
jgi:chromosome partitioning protein